jgi:site-specific DNA recombinase
MSGRASPRRPSPSPGRSSTLAPTPSARGWVVSDQHIFVDDGISGAEFVKRPGFIRMMNALKPRPPFEVLILSEQSRLGREQTETAIALRRLANAGARVLEYLTDRELKRDTAVDKFLTGAMAFVDEMHREQTRQRVRDALKRKAALGYLTGGVPFGYQRVLVGDHAELQVREAETAIVRGSTTCY